ncbi:MAG: BrnA antitoxin family protein [Pseudomonadota bacterium]
MVKAISKPEFPSLTMQTSNTPRRRASFHRLSHTVHQIEKDMSPDALREQLPGDWHGICDHPDPEKQRVTIRLDRDVVKFFRALGPKWQPRLNRVLRAFVLGRMAGIIAGPETKPLGDEVCPTCGGVGSKLNFERARSDVLERLRKMEGEG